MRCAELGRNGEECGDERLSLLSGIKLWGPHKKERGDESPGEECRLWAGLGVSGVVTLQMLRGCGER